MSKDNALLISVANELLSRQQENPTHFLDEIQGFVEYVGFDHLTGIEFPGLHDAVMLLVESGRGSDVALASIMRIQEREVTFLTPFTRDIFRGDDGLVAKDLRAAKALYGLRQLLLLFSKKKVLPSPEVSAAAVDSFFATERELRERRSSILSWLDSSEFLAVSDALYGPLFDKVERQLWHSHVLPFSHGPGSTAEGSFSAAKFPQLRRGWTARLEKVFPLREVGFVNLHHADDFFGVESGEYPDYPVLSPHEQPSMKIALVPKTMKTPRIIAMEPVAQQFTQQMLMRLIGDGISSSDLSALLDMRDQTRNRRLARLGSENGSLATLDLSEASDRLHVSVVAKMLRHHPLLRKAVFACRTTTADFEGRKVRLEKFAPMGSALCFVFETLAFFGMLATVANMYNGGSSSRITHGRIVRLCKSLNLSAYGDDLIVPVAFAESAVLMLETFGLKVNRRKSFWSGSFRESCGGDYFAGYDVSVARVRQSLDSTFGPSLVLSVIGLQHELYSRFLWDTSTLVCSWYPRVPVYPSDIQLAGYYFIGDSGSAGSRVRFNRHLQTIEYSTLQPKVKARRYHADDWDELYRWFITVNGNDEAVFASATDRRAQVVGLRSAWSRVI